VADRSLTVNGVLLRVGLAVALVLATLNPTGWNYLHWATEGIEAFGPAKLIVGLLLAAAWILYVRAAWQSIGLVGALLIAAVIGAFVWLAIDSGWLDPANTSALMWIGLIGLGLMLGIGLSWSHFRRRITGQVDVEDDAAL
jgi:hypothetical protein